MKGKKILSAAFFAAAALTALCYLGTLIFRALALTPYMKLALVALSSLCGFMAARISASADSASREKLMRGCFRAVTALFVLFLLDVTLLDSVFRLSDGIRRVNFVPGTTIAEFLSSDMPLGGFIINILGNILVFTPLSLLLPLCSRKLSRFGAFAAATAAFIVAIEIMQCLLCVGVCDIDDFILNTAGMYIMYAILHITPLRSIISRVCAVRY